MSEKMAAYIDHTLLKPEAKRSAVLQLCREAKQHSFYSVCVNPCNVSLAAAELEGSAVLVCAVIGFPLGAATTKIKVLEAEDAVKNGASELDVVINIGRLRDRDDSYVQEELSAVVCAAGGRTVKVIIETALLNEEEKVRACRLAMASGANYVKTSTGFGPGGATVEDVRLMRETVGEKPGVKASGGIRSAEDARRMIAAGATRIGTSSGISIVGNYQR